MRYLILFFIAAFALVGCTQASTPGVSTDGTDTRQETYNALLRTARQEIRADPALKCDPTYQDLVIIQLDAPDAQKVLVRLAMSDACKEAGKFNNAEYSAYYAEAP